MDTSARNRRSDVNRRLVRRALPAPLAVVALAGLVSACGGGSGGGNGSLTIGVPPVVGLGDLYTADSKGFFTKRGLHVTIKSLNGGAALVPAMQSGSVQIGQSNVVSVLQAKQRHLDIKCFASGFRSPSGPQLPLIVSPKHKSSIKKPADLTGKTIAVNTLHNSNQLIAEAYLKSHGVNPASVHFISLEYPDMPGALASGRVAAAITDEPFTTISASRGATVMAPQPDRVVAKHPVYACWVVTGKWMKSNKKQVSKFMGGLTQADKYIAAHPDYVRKILPKYTKVSAKLARKVTLPDWTTHVTAADIQAWAKVASRFGIAKPAGSASSIIATVPPGK